MSKENGRSILDMLEESKEVIAYIKSINDEMTEHLKQVSAIALITGQVPDLENESTPEELAKVTGKPLFNKDPQGNKAFEIYEEVVVGGIALIRAQLEFDSGLKPKEVTDE